MIELSGDEHLGSMVNACTKLAMRTRTRASPIRAASRTPVRLYEACRGCVAVTDRTKLCSLARMLNG